MRIDLYCWIESHCLILSLYSRHCTGDDDQSSFPIFGNDVTIFPYELDGSNRTASSKVGCHIVTLDDHWRNS